MANNYVQSSSFLTIPADKLSRAQGIIDVEVVKIEASDDEYCGCVIKVDPRGVWFSHDEGIDVAHVEIVARALIETLELDEPFLCSWAYTCSKPRIDEFGGGAFLIARGYQTCWCDAANYVMTQFSTGGLHPRIAETTTNDAASVEECRSGIKDKDGKTVACPSYRNARSGEGSQAL